MHFDSRSTVAERTADGVPSFGAVISPAELTRTGGGKGVREHGFPSTPSNEPRRRPLAESRNVLPVKTSCGVRGLADIIDTSCLCARTKFWAPSGKLDLHSSFPLSRSEATRTPP